MDLVHEELSLTDQFLKLKVYIRYLGFILNRGLVKVANRNNFLISIALLSGMFLVMRF